jgi:hypothetical protein
MAHLPRLVTGSIYRGRINLFFFLFFPFFSYFFIFVYFLFHDRCLTSNKTNFFTMSVAFTIVFYELALSLGEIRLRMHAPKGTPLGPLGPTFCTTTIVRRKNAGKICAWERDHSHILH